VCATLKKGNASAGSGKKRGRCTQFGSQQITRSCWKKKETDGGFDSRGERGGFIEKDGSPSFRRGKGCPKWKARRPLKRSRAPMMERREKKDSFIKDGKDDQKDRGVSSPKRGIYSEKTRYGRGGRGGA